ncbi:hypothetical protein [Nannocystis bainbridge]|uniref:Uncharacterized protein n=1 Tax=Nannocystis bainbridge TaxID=2995303 RepID=A0ABT5E7V6_9BACT|nr:hypothetical protein [Nannocystis bainbridge]MDC0720917.1 hypothetical protein [Nannocystis bainbridge]
MQGETNSETTTNTSLQRARAGLAVASPAVRAPRVPARHHDITRAQDDDDDDRDES